jgi:hypothetical protein
VIEGFLTSPGSGNGANVPTRVVKTGNSASPFWMCHLTNVARSSGKNLSFLEVGQARLDSRDTAERNTKPKNKSSSHKHLHVHSWSLNTRSYDDYECPRCHASTTAESIIDWTGKENSWNGSDVVECED